MERPGTNIYDIMTRVAFSRTGPEVCAANPENCEVDKISEMVENGDCLEYHCADGYIGEDCNSKYYRVYCINVHVDLEYRILDNYIRDV